MTFIDRCLDWLFWAIDWARTILFHLAVLLVSATVCYIAIGYWLRTLGITK
jgi:hypothetical protein